MSEHVFSNGGANKENKMAYTYDIFISYRRNPETLLWINEHFKPLLTLRLEAELTYSPKFYVDDQMESGSSWPAALGVALGSSRALIALYSASYFSSVWCAEEFAQMLMREKQAKLRTAANPHGLIIPAFIHDGDSFPTNLKHIQPFEIQPQFSPRMARTGGLAEQLDVALAKQAAAIAASIKCAPKWTRTWTVKAAKVFFNRYYRHARTEQTSVPRFTRARPSGNGRRPGRGR